jgi:hypothetical protein
MKRFSALILTICFFLTGCIGQPFTSISSTNQPIPDNASGTAAGERSVTGSPESSNSLTVIPMEMGYGVRGPWFELYFTDPVNPAAKLITGGPDGPLVAAIDSAHLTLDAAIYSLSLHSVRDALIHAFRREVNVRVVMESDNMDSAAPQSLMEAGLPMLGDHVQGLMHNKFVVIDRSDVWAGSMNFTNEVAYANNNNLMHIHSEKQRKIMRPNSTRCMSMISSVPKLVR